MTYRFTHRFATVATALIVLLASAPFARADAIENMLCDALGELDGIAATLCADGALSSDPLPVVDEIDVDIDIGASTGTVTVTVPDADGATTTVEEAFNIPVNIPIPFLGCRLTVIKEVQGGTATSSDFDIHILRSGVDVTGSPFAGSWTGTTFELGEGFYTVTESGGPDGYTPQFSGACDSEGRVGLTLSSEAVCRITNVFTATSTPPDTSTTTPPTGGGGGEDNPPSGGGGGGGGAPPDGIGGGGDTSGGITITVGAPAPAPQPDGIGGGGDEFPGIPNTGTGGANGTILLVSGFSAIIGLLLLRWPHAIRGHRENRR